MTTTHNQDLILFEDHSLIPESIISGEESYSAIISHLQGTSPTWLINSLIENSIQNTATLVNNDLTVKQTGRSKTIFISFINNKDYYSKGCKKNGIDLNTVTDFTYIDCFTDLFTKRIKDPSKASSQVTSLFQELNEVISSQTGSRKVVFIEAPEILLRATNITSNELLNHLLQLNKTCRQLFIISAKDYPDLDAAMPEDPVFKVTDYFVKLLHRSSLHISIQPLLTGRANDITGSLIVSKGPISYKSINVSEKEYIFNITKDSNIKLFFR
ncbi:hypothetical protein DFJ63DRAFT_333241 [Scheffersomyces coipomensis]|uniref:uncharacterized protein n=1 Tax=Scheffersomyces coipomensis TaxID=1788519 RepID=UPI00315D97BE